MLNPIELENSLTERTLNFGVQLSLIVSGEIKVEAIGSFIFVTNLPQAEKARGRQVRINADYRG